MEEMVQLLLERGADPNAGGALARAAHRAAPGIVRLLVDKGAVLSGTYKGRTPRAWAEASDGPERDEVIRILDEYLAR